MRICYLEEGATTQVNGLVQGLGACLKGLGAEALIEADDILNGDLTDGFKSLSVVQNIQSHIIVR